MSNIHVLELSGYETPSIHEEKSKEWVTYGKDNSYYDYLRECWEKSATNGSVINAISRLIYGKGLSALDAQRKPNDYATLINLFPASDLKKCALDLKALGQFAFQVHYTTKGKRLVKKCLHLPIQLLAPEKCDENGEIKAYYYSDNWKDTKKFEPKRYKAFGTSNDEIEVMFVHGIQFFTKYFSTVDYNGATPYAYLEKQIADFLINDVDNGFSGTKVVNFNNGVPSEEKQKIISGRVKGQLTGVNGDKVIIAFNNDETKKTTVDNIPLDDAPEHYRYLSEECTKKILAGHSVTSPMLVGIMNDNQGFNSNAEEIDRASTYFYNTVIKPFQDTLIDAIDKVLAVNGISLNLYFKRLNLFEDVEKTMQQQEQQQQQQLNLSKQDEEISSKLIEKGGEIDLDQYELIDTRDVDYDLEDELDKSINEANNPTLLSKIVHLVSTGTAYPKRKSEIDGELFLSRYRYVGEVRDNSREFCKAMLKANKLYRKEDIIAMGELPVNKGWGPEGADTYSIWLYKGGGLCGHKWQRETYRKKGTDLSSPLKKEVTPSQARKEGEILPTAPKKVYERPRDMPYEGFLPTNKRFN